MRSRTHFGMTVIWAVSALAALAEEPTRRVIPLDGVWQVTEGSLDRVPEQFEHTAPVPGLADLATPPFESPGSTVSLDERGSPWLRPADPRREAFWYRRTFTVSGPLPAVALLKVHKARYGTKVLLNGRSVGEHGPNFTPGWFDVRPHLKADGAENELLIRVGASLAQVPLYLNDGWDNEKSRYIPGIYDSVELILCGTPHVVNVQCVPDVAKSTVKAVVELANAGTVATAPTIVKAVVTERATGRVAGEASATTPTPGTGSTNKVELTVAIRDPHPWTPEDPFLYDIAIDTGVDALRTRFGLRTFATDPESGRVLLNGKPYYLRGSNVCIYRFFEDSQRGALPWDREWVRSLHRRFKEMHWNSLRYCIGFPPERWYEIADEEGILIQDEFPIWYSRAKDGWPEAITPEHLAVEYTEWMRERWNHPCVAIWDAQNETANDRVIAATIGMVRGLDLSRRPWDNGWGTPQQPGDISESHPYRSGSRGFSLANFARENGIPDNGPRKGTAKPPYLINEYGWLWINRDGSLPTLTVEVYKRLLGEDATPEERFRYYARMLAAKTEFWRVRRQCAGVLHFCGLGYSRPDGQTSDHFSNVQKLEFEPNFYAFVRDAFAPVGVAIDWWETVVDLGTTAHVPVRIINDLEADWQGEVVLRLERDGKLLSTQSKPVSAAGWSLGTAEFDVAFPADGGCCGLIAEICDAAGQPIRSHRQVRVEKIPENLAFNRPAKASSEVRNAQGFFPAVLAVDGKPETYWSSEFSDDHWLTVDLGAPRRIARIRIEWQAAFSKAFAVQVSLDGESWTDVYSTANGKGGTSEICFDPVQARHLRVHGTRRGTEWGHAICELQVFEAE